MLNDIITKHSSSFAPGASTELRLHRNLARRVAFQNGNLVTNSRADVKGVSARVYKEGLYGFASSSEISEDAVRSVLSGATYNAAFLDKHVGLGKGPLPKIEQTVLPPQEDMVDLPQKTYIEYLKALDAYIAKTYPDLVSRAVIATCDSMEKLLATSDGAQSHIIAPRGYVYLMMTAQSEDGAPVELFEVAGGRGTFDKNFGDPAELYAKVDGLYEKLMKKREGVHAEAGKKVCVLDGVLAGMLAHEAVGHTVEADLVLGGSVARNLLHQQVASPLISMVDYAHTAFGEVAPLPVYVDDEGVVARDAELIRDGVLKGYMVNRETGRFFDMEPLGNARAWAFNDEPLIRMRNTAVLPGKDKIEDIISSVEDGYYLTDTNNGQADTTGEFMFGISMGYEIKNGKLGRAILDTTISGIAFEMLKTVTMVGDKVKWGSSGFCGKKQPMPVGLGGPALKCEVTIGGR